MKKNIQIKKVGALTQIKAMGSGMNGNGKSMEASAQVFNNSTANVTAGNNLGNHMGNFIGNNMMNPMMNPTMRPIVDNGTYRRTIVGEFMDGERSQSGAFTLWGEQARNFLAKVGDVVCIEYNMRTFSKDGEIYFNNLNVWRVSPVQDTVQDMGTQSSVPANENKEVEQINQLNLF